MKNGGLTILHVTDLHFYKPFYLWLLTQIGNFDVLCITGDLIGEISPLEKIGRSEQVNWVSSWLEQLTKPVFICSGNHDVDSDIDLLADLEDLIGEVEFSSSNDNDRDFWLNKINNPLVFTDSSIHSIGNCIFGCVPYYSSGLDRYHGCDVLLHHDPPYNSKTSIQAGENFGSYELYQALMADTVLPSYLLCGHVHRPLANKDKIKNSFVSNPGASFVGNIPNHKYIETQKG